MVISSLVVISTSLSLFKYKEYKSIHSQASLWSGGYPLQHALLDHIGQVKILLIYCHNRFHGSFPHYSQVIKNYSYPRNGNEVGWGGAVGVRRPTPLPTSLKISPRFPTPCPNKFNGVGMGWGIPMWENHFPILTPFTYFMNKWFL